MTKQNYEPYVAPSGTSGWFMPSIYQWNMIVNGLTNSAISFTTSSNNALKSSVFYNPLTLAGGTALQSGYYFPVRSTVITESGSTIPYKARQTTVQR